VTSAIVPTNPVQGNATTSSVRFNFEKAHDEINVLQRMSTEVKETSSSDGVSYTANFTDAVVLGEGVRVSVEINTVNTNTAPTLNANGTGAKTIVRQDGSALVAGDLKAGQYVDLIYDATATKWVWLNSPYAQLITSLKEEIAANVYPVGSIFTTTTDYSDSSNGAAVTTALGMASTVQWSRYAKGRTIVGFDSGYTPSAAATSSSDNVIQLTFTASEGESGQLHPFGVGDTITTSGFTTSQANVTNGTVTEATANTIKYASSSSISSGATVTIGSGKVVNTAMDTALEAGGASTLTKDMLPAHSHLVVKNEASTGTDITTSSQTIGRIRSQGSGGLINSNFEYDLGAVSSGRADSGQTSDTGSGGSNNNLQPYITTYIWKRTA
jgi:hypothetical protein